MSPAKRRGILIGGALLVVVVVVAAFFLLNSGGSAPQAEAGAGATSVENPGALDPHSAITEYLQDLSENNPDAAGRLTDDDTAAAVALRDTRNTLNPSSVTAKLTVLQPTPAGAKQTGGTFNVSWALKPGQVWTYDVPFQLAQVNGKWLVHWAPSLLHPKLEAGQRLVISTAVRDTTAVADRDGKPLLVSGSGGVRPVDGDPAPLLRSALTGQVTAAAGNGFAVERVDTSGKSVETLFGQAAEGEAKALTSSLSLAAQNAAQAAVDSYQGSAMLVALDTGSGDILAVAQNRAAGNSPKALNGLYEPGSSFKIATSVAAVQQSGLDAGSPVDCPGVATIGTRTVKNEGFELGATNLQTAFARSCNTTFGQLALALPADGLKKAADELGLNADYEIPGINTELGKVEPAASKDEQVEDGFGQGRIQASCLGGALMAATVASGKAITPRLWHDVETKVVKGYSPPPASVLGQVRTLMRAVVSSGTGRGAASAGTVFGKTGTAQFGDGSNATGWFVGYRGNVAFSVVLENSNDSGPAVTLAAKFLKAL
ncbi:penicillin-binding transpeptidase domain-containing protein [Amycolatopsis australiensis]|uniref:NTF2-like N-terminal transpeptidase domain-containing protein n=1 Tax=Amycolatopsis australiensis TaxID=546364 RepID=A0A1K1RXB6_9PSEU|nr:penicillin-binding transpeptidase domain-containing protein [Amycolatopsis australiensis]SFW76713.1 NTF2-like N-terminal transpeptidase domain-containing protein [Amycolatopsis australiensis]